MCETLPLKSNWFSSVISLQRADTFMSILTIRKLRLHGIRWKTWKFPCSPHPKPMPGSHKAMMRHTTLLLLPSMSCKCEQCSVLISHKYILIDNVNKVHFIIYLERIHSCPGSILPSRWGRTIPHSVQGPLICHWDLCYLDRTSFFPDFSKQNILVQTIVSVMDAVAVVSTFSPRSCVFIFSA